MPAIAAIHDKTTGQLIDEVEVEVRQHPTKYKAMIEWRRRSITNIDHGHSESEAIQNVFNRFCSGPVMSQYDVRLLHKARRA